MHRIDGAGATVGGQWTEGNPGTGTPATELTADWMNAVQNELENVIVTGAGIPLNKASNTQLLAAIQAIITATTYWSTGDVKPTFKTAADTGWVMMNDGTIGDASSGATTRANADTSLLYTLLWTNVADAWAPVTGGRGGSAAADFAAHKPMRLPRALGRALAISGTGAYTTTFTADAGTDVLTVAANNSLYTGEPVTVSTTGGLPGGLAAVTTYYVIRTASTTLRLATSLANAHAGTYIDITSTGTGVHTMTMAMTSRGLGEHLGEESHVSIADELAPHAHPIPSGGAQSGGGVSTNYWQGTGPASGTSTSLSTATGAAHNNMQPSTFLNVMIKL